MLWRPDSDPKRPRRGYLNLGLGLDLGLSQHAAASIISPADLANLALWLKADAGAFQSAGGAAAGNGDVVGEWQDQSGNGAHVVQATAANKPLLVTNVQNGLPVVRFDGADDFFSLAAALSGNAHSIFVAFKSADAQALGMFLNDSANATIYFGVGDPTTLYLITGAVPLAERTFSGATSWHIFEARRDDPTLQVFVDGTAGTAVSHTGAFSANRIGHYSTATYRLQGDLGELLIYTRDLPSAERAQVRAYLRARWGTP